MIDILQNVLTDMILGMINGIPGFINGLVVLAVGWILARIIGKLIAQVVDRLGMDAILDRLGMKENMESASITQSAGELIGLFFFWMIFLNFLLAALNVMGLQAAVQPLERFILFLPQILVALITFIAGLMLAQFLGRTVNAMLSSIGVEYHQTVASTVQTFVSLIVVIIVLQQLGMDVTLLTDLLTNIVTLIVAGIALAFALGGRVIARNVLSGHYAREMFMLGDWMELDGQAGTLEAIGTLNAEIAVEGERLVVPNVRLTEAAVKVNTNRPYQEANPADE